MTTEGVILNAKTKLYFGPPLAELTKNEGNTLEISGRVNRTAERYLALLGHYGLTLNEPEIACLRAISMIGHLSVDEIAYIADDVDQFREPIEGLDKDALFEKLKNASFVELVVTLDKLGL